MYLSFSRRESLVILLKTIQSLFKLFMEQSVEILNIHKYACRKPTGLRGAQQARGVSTPTSFSHSDLTSLPAPKALLPIPSLPVVPSPTCKTSVTPHRETVLEGSALEKEPLAGQQSSLCEMLMLYQVPPLSPEEHPPVDWPLLVHVTCALFSPSSSQV